MISITNRPSSSYSNFRVAFLAYFTSIFPSASPTGAPFVRPIANPSCSYWLSSDDVSLKSMEGFGVSSTSVDEEKLLSAII